MISVKERNILKSLGFVETYTNGEESRWHYPEPVIFEENGQEWLFGRSYNKKTPNGKFWARIPKECEKPTKEWYNDYDGIRGLPLAEAYYKARDSETSLDEFIPADENINHTASNFSVTVTENPKSNIIDFTSDQIEIIKNTVAKNATDNELKMFLHLASKYGLDPFAKEIFFTKIESKRYPGSHETTIMTSRDGYLTIAQRDTNYDGLLSAVVKTGDVFKFNPSNPENPINHEFGDSRGDILGAWAVCYHKNRKPSIAFVDFKEYEKNSRTWQQYPSAMIQKVAEAFVLKRQFGISGLVTKEELEG